MKKISIAVSIVLGFVANTVIVNACDDPGAPEYVVMNGKVDKGTYNGCRRFHGTCHACHGQDALGSSFAPSLVDSLKTLSYEEFAHVVLEGRQSQSGAGASSVMPAFAHDRNITKHLDDIYRYLKARSDGELAGGRPARLPKK